MLNWLVVGVLIAGVAQASSPNGFPLPDRRAKHDNAFADVDRHSGVAPVYVTGHFTGRKEGGVPLALGVNGRIAAVGASYPVRDATRFSMLIPSQSLRPGRNVVEVFAVTAGRLLRLGRAPH